MTDTQFTSVSVHQLYSIVCLMTDICLRKLAYIDVYPQNVWLMIVYLQEVSQRPLMAGV